MSDDTLRRRRNPNSSRGRRRETDDPAAPSLPLPPRTPRPPLPPCPSTETADAELPLTERIVRFYAEGHTVARISSLARCSEGYVRTVLSKRGLTPPQRAKDGRRDKPLPVPYSAEERELLASRADAAGMSLAAYVRHMSLYGIRAPTIK